MWEAKRLGEVCSFQEGYVNPTQTREDYFGNDIKWLRVNDLNNSYIFDTSRKLSRKGFKSAGASALLFEPETIAISKSGTIGRLGILKDYMCGNRAVINIKPNEQIVNCKYIFYCLLNKHTEIESSAVGSVQKNLYISLLEKVKLNVPPLPTQLKIADILSAYDDLIDNSNRRIKLLEQAAQQLYKEWFVRFRFPGYETAHFTKGIPDGWEIVKLGTEINITSSKRIFLSDYVENGVPFYRSREVIQLANGKAIIEPLFIEAEKYIQIKTRFGVPVEKDILLTSVGTIGISLLVKNNTPFYFKDGNLTWLQSSTKPLFALYLYLWLNSDTGKQRILASAIGTSQSALTIENLNRVKLIRPDNSVLYEFSEIITSINAQLENLRIKKLNLIKQRDLLLPRLMSGKIEV